MSRLDSPEAWAFRVGFNLANSRLRRMQCERRANRRVVSTREPQHDEAQAIAVREAVRTLPKRQRAALVLRYFADLSVEQTAAVMKCAPGTVKALTSQAISRLRVEFDFGPDEEQEDADRD